MSDTPATIRNHLLIAGTGRAGTSFIVRYLTQLGLDTTLARQGDTAFWDDNANAGLEEVPSVDRAAWPYVVKTPWLYQFVDQLLADTSFTIDAVIVPVRSLQEAAASRIILELRAIHAAHPWMAEDEQPRSEWGSTAGGCFMPLEPLDQARMLAVGFYNLVERLVRADIPVVLLAFPRLAEDPDYLFSRLAPFLPDVTAGLARRIHAALAEPSKVRVGDELRSVSTHRRGRLADGDVDLAGLNDVALRRELARVRKELVAAVAGQADARAETARAREEIEALNSRNETLAAARQDLSRLTMALEDADARATQAVRETEIALQQVQDLKRRNEALTAELGRMGNEVQRLNTVFARAMDDKAAEVRSLRTDLASLTGAHQVVLNSTSWRITKPIRSIGARVPAAARNLLRPRSDRVHGDRSNTP